MVNSLARDLVGRGPRLQVLTPSEQVNRRVQDTWNAWGKAVGLARKLRTLAKAKVQDGEAFGLLTTNRTLRATLGGKLGVNDAVQLDLQVIESDQVTTPDPGFLDYFWVDGIVLDKLGNPTEYHVLRHHPGDLFMPQLNPLVYDRWPAASVCHWFRQDRPGQVRGIPEITPALDLFAQLRRFTKATITAAEVAADFAAYLKSDAPASTDDEDGYEPFDTLSIDRGMLTTLPAGMDISQLKAEHPATTYEMFVRVILREAARCLDVPLNIALGDSSGYNYSSGRLDHLGYHEQQRVDRGDCEDSVLEPLFGAWVEEAVMVPGLLPPGVESVEQVPHRWLWNRAGSIDPQKDAEANRTELANGTRTLAAIYAERGEDWEEALRQRARELALARKLAEEAGVPLAMLVGGASGEAASPEPEEEEAAA